MNIYLELRNKSASVLWPSNINRKHTSNETEGRYDLVHENYTKSQSLKGQTIPTCFYAVRYTVTICIDVLVLHCNLSKFTHQRNDKTEYICGYAIMYFSNGRCFVFFKHKYSYIHGNCHQEHKTSVEINQISSFRWWCIVLGDTSSCV